MDFNIIGMAGNKSNNTSNITNISNSDNTSLIENNNDVIYFSSHIDRFSSLKFTKIMNELNYVNYSNFNYNENNNHQIDVVINSPGGSVLDGFMCMDAILLSKRPVNTIITGGCASAGSFMSIVGKKRYITPHGHILIHQLSGFSFGTYREILDDTENATKFMKTMKSIYKKYTKVPMSKLDELLKHDLWFDAKEAKDLGMVDEIIGEEFIEKIHKNGTK